MHASMEGHADLSDNIRLLTDSRLLTDPRNTLFFAIRTAWNDGHRYIPELLEKGVRAFVVEEGYEIPDAPDSVFFSVKNSVEALQALGAWHRKKFSMPVAGITGSNGKTIVKEWLLQLLAGKMHVCANPKSYNSQIGVPLSVWNLRNDHTLGIFEAGISRPGEMENLEKIIAPGIGILTHLGSAHNEGFENPAQKLKEKTKLFKNCSTVLMLYQPEIIPQLSCNVVTYGYNEPKADLNILKTERAHGKTNIEGIYAGRQIRFGIPFTDDASVENACLCALVTLFLNCYEEQDFASLRPVSMRLELKKGINRSLLVNDSYSNDLTALGTALAFLKQQAAGQKLTVILSDIEESGLDRQILYVQVERLLRENGIQKLIGIGPECSAAADILKKIPECRFYPDTASFIQDIYRHPFHEENILIKGARKFGFEQIVKALERESHGTVLEINLTAALNNLNLFKNLLPPDVKIMAMVKAFAYGSGSYEMAKLLQDKVDYLAVAYTDEGVELRKSGVSIPVMVMNAGEESAEQLLHWNLEPVVYGMNQFRALVNAAAGSPLRIHIEIDTGMHRLGFEPDEIPTFCGLLARYPDTQVVSVFSHLSASDDPEFDDFTDRQFERFKNAAAEFEEITGRKVLKHISNTAGILRFRQKGLDMVRLGIGLYGINPVQNGTPGLEPVFTFRTHISQIREVAGNESIGYSGMAVSPRKRKIATLAIGYADGLSRSLGNATGGFYINGKYAPIAGNVCMDMCMIDVSDIDCREGDEAVLFDREHPVEEIAEKQKTIPYEILTSVSQRVKRVYVRE